MKGFLFAALFSCSALLAATETDAEIQYLLKFIQNTPCSYERNGTRYTGAEALAHIQKKYTYFKADIDSTERFIDLSASKSTLSGKVYLVHCPNKPVQSSQAWLLSALSAYRQQVATPLR